MREVKIYNYYIKDNYKQLEHVQTARDLLGYGRRFIVDIYGRDTWVFNKQMFLIVGFIHKWQQGKLLMNPRSSFSLELYKGRYE